MQTVHDEVVELGWEGGRYMLAAPQYAVLAFLWRVSKS